MQLNTACFTIRYRFRERLKRFGNNPLFYLSQNETFVAVYIVEDPSDV